MWENEGKRPVILGVRTNLQSTVGTMILGQEKPFYSWPVVSWLLYSWRNLKLYAQEEKHTRQISNKSNTTSRRVLIKNNANIIYLCIYVYLYIYICTYTYIYI